MRPHRFRETVVLWAAAAGLCLLGTLPAGAAEDSPLVLELFTSQGCSSCPPAEALFSRLGRRPGVIALAWHVDYWNRLGWTDPFSQPAASGRQNRYAGWFQEDHVYTPQLIVNGASGFVASDRNLADREIAGARRLEWPMLLSATVQRKGAGAADVLLTWSPRWRPQPEDAEFSAVIVIRESSLLTLIRRGENANLSVVQDFVVRTAHESPSIRYDEKPRRYQATLELPSELKPADASVVALLQDLSTGVLIGAATAPLPR